MTRRNEKKKQTTERGAHPPGPPKWMWRGQTKNEKNHETPPFPNWQTKDRRLHINHDKGRSWGLVQRCSTSEPRTTKT